MSWGQVHGHEELVASLQKLAAEGRLPHAFLFAGPEGVGKRLFAFTFAQALLCDRRSDGPLEPCGACPSCHMVQALTHPDFLVAQRPEDKHELSIEVIRGLNHELSLKPARGPYRVAIVKDAHAMSEEAANAFLKTLEEPPPGSVLILITSSSEQQLDTVVSRCRVLQFLPLKPSELRSALAASGIATLDELELDRLVTAAEGSVGRALALADPSFMAFRRGILDALCHPGGFDAPSLARQLEAHARAAGKESAQVRQRASLLVVELSRFFRAVMLQSQGLEPPTSDPGDAHVLSALSQKLSFDQTAQVIQACLDADYQIARKAYLPLVLDCLLLKIKEQIT